MPWQVKELFAMKKEFVLLFEQAGSDRRALCRRFGISAECGYKWWRAYQEQGELGLEEKSRRPRNHPEQTSPEMEKWILELRGRQPSWGTQAQTAPGKPWLGCGAGG